MLRRIMTELDVVKGLRSIQEKILVSCQKRPVDFQKFQPRLVAVSKTKPKELIIAAYSAGQRHFGENYVQELIDKSHDSEIIELCPDICWHFIGHLQRNKVNKLLTASCLHMVETVDTDKLATTLNTAWSKQVNKKDNLKVMVQINTSGEKEKSGCQPDEAIALVKHVKDNCPSLELSGLMTIGEYGYNLELGPNPDFIGSKKHKQSIKKFALSNFFIDSGICHTPFLAIVRWEVAKCLRRVRDEVCAALGIDYLELSMGMSNDFEHAIEMGSSNIRVGSSIFGYREPKAKAEASA